MQRNTAYRAVESALAPTAASDNPMARHWRGEYGLGVSYWINTVAVGAALDTATRALESIFPGVLGDRFAVFLASYLAIMLVVGTWQMVGLWRSACRHVNLGGKLVWAFLAKAIVVFGWMLLLLTSSALIMVIAKAMTFSPPVA